MFSKEKLIRFQLCDPAGIVFFPQYFVLFHEVMEDWFNEGLGGDYSEFVLKRRMGLPIVKAECDFLSPNPMGDRLVIDLAVRTLGRSSLVLAFRGHVDGRECVRAALTNVHTSLEAMKSVPIPDPLRASIQRFVAPSDSWAASTPST